MLMINLTYQLKTLKISSLSKTIADLAFVWVFKVVAGRGEEVAFGKIFPKFSNLIRLVMIIFATAIL